MLAWRAAAFNGQAELACVVCALLLDELNELVDVESGDVAAIDAHDLVAIEKACARRCAARRHVAQPVAALLVDVTFELETVRLVGGARVLAEHHVECTSGRFFLNDLAIVVVVVVVITTRLAFTFVFGRLFFAICRRSVQFLAVAGLDFVLVVVVAVVVFIEANVLFSDTRRTHPCFWLMENIFLTI